MKIRNTETDERSDLTRLRREYNRLFRDSIRCRTDRDQEVRLLRRRIEALRQELTAIKNSRVWRTANRLRRLLPGSENVGSVLIGAGRSKPEFTSRKRSPREEQYKLFLKNSESTAGTRIELKKKVDELAHRPLISVVMPVYNTDPTLLLQAVESVFQQIYEKWELCLVDDGTDREGTQRQLSAFDHPQLKIRHLDRNQDIASATNAAIDMTTGDFVAFMDHDDQLTIDALAEVVCAVNENDADFIYSDEDYVSSDGERTNPHFKPDYSPDLLLSHNYITHLVVVSRKLLEHVGSLRSEFDGAQDYDFVLRATEKAKNIIHIPKVLYHWRLTANSTSMHADSKPRAAERGRQALAAALKRRSKREGTVLDADIPHFYRVKYSIDTKPLVSIVMPFKDKPDLLHCAIGDILEKSTYQNYEILGINNGSREEGTFEAMRDLSGIDERIKFLEHDVPFNFSAIVNYGEKHCRGTHVVLMNNDIRVVSDDWIEALLEHSQREEIGAVGGKLYYPDGRIQHAGVIIGIGGYAGHACKGFPGSHQGYYNRLKIVQNVSAVTGAFMMVKKAIYDAAGGFNETEFGVACNDVDFCLRLREQGYWNVFTPYAEACHLESASRGYEDTPEKMDRFARERELFTQRHGRVLKSGDPFYNRNLTTTAEDFTLRLSSN